MVLKKNLTLEFEARAATTEWYHQSAVDLLKHGVSDLVGMICEDDEATEVKASAIALTSLAAFLVGLAAARTGSCLEDFAARCQEQFLDHARQSYQGHATDNLRSGFNS